LCGQLRSRVWLPLMIWQRKGHESKEGKEGGEDGDEWKVQGACQSYVLLKGIVVPRIDERCGGAYFQREKRKGGEREVLGSPLRREKTTSKTPAEEKPGRGKSMRSSHSRKAGCLLYY